MNHLQTLIQQLVNDQMQEANETIHQYLVQKVQKMMNEAKQSLESRYEKEAKAVAALLPTKAAAEEELEHAGMSCGALAASMRVGDEDIVRDLIANRLDALGVTGYSS